MRLIELDGQYFNSDHIAVIRESPLDEDQTVIFTIGQSATSDGFLLNLPLDDVLDELEKARYLEVADTVELRGSSDEEVMAHDRS